MLKWFLSLIDPEVREPVSQAYEVKSAQFNRYGKNRDKLMLQRTEVIRTIPGDLFEHAQNEEDVKRIYEGFWNNNPNSVEIVKVITVKKLEG